MIENLQRLWSLSGKDPAIFAESQNSYFDPVGLNFYTSIENIGYWCTPKNTATFATTGGDGVHFGFLKNGGAILETSPIVMTLPSAETTNIIVGETFLEFLSLGCRGGYFDLEQIEYRPHVHIPFLDSRVYSPDMKRNEITLLQAIEKEFNLSPWSNHFVRLAELKLRYIGQLEYSAEYYEITA